MSRNEKQLKEIIKTLGGTYSENDNCTCELLGRVNEGLKNVLGSGSDVVIERETIELSIDDFEMTTGTHSNGEEYHTYTLTLDNSNGDYNNKFIVFNLTESIDEIQHYVEIYITGKLLYNTVFRYTGDGESNGTLCVTVYNIDVNFNLKNNDHVMCFGNNEVHIIEGNLSYMTYSAVFNNRIVYTYSNEV